MSEPPPHWSGIPPVNAHPATFTAPEQPSNPFDSRPTYASQRLAQSNTSYGRSAYAPQESTQSDRYNDRSIYGPSTGNPPYTRPEPWLSRTTAYPTTFAPPTSSSNGFSSHSTYAPQESTQSDRYNDRSIYGPSTGNPPYTRPEPWLSRTTAYPTTFAPPTSSSNGFSSHSTYAPQESTQSDRYNDRSIYAPWTAHSTYAAPETSLLPPTSADLVSSAPLSPRDHSLQRATMAGTMTGHNGGHATHVQQQMDRDLQSIPDTGSSFKCDQCTNDFIRINELHSHYYQKHPERLKCDQCCNGFAVDHDLETHQRIHRDFPFKCDQCHQAFATSRGLSTHEHHQHAARRFFCHFCNAPFAKLTFLRVRFSPIDSANP